MKIQPKSVNLESDVDFQDEAPKKNKSKKKTEKEKILSTVVQ
jgi:hypothetical protein